MLIYYLHFQATTEQIIDRRQNVSKTKRSGKYIHV